MSLVPSEQHLLTRIEHSLRSTDPRLARMLATFTLPAFRGGLAHLFRSRRREFVPPALTLVAIGLIVCCGLLLGRVYPVRCTHPGVAAGSPNTCRTAGGTARQPSGTTSTQLSTSGLSGGGLNPASHSAG